MPWPVKTLPVSSYFTYDDSENLDYVGFTHLRWLWNPYFAS